MWVEVKQYHKYYFVVRFVNFAEEVANNRSSCCLDVGVRCMSFLEWGFNPYPLLRETAVTKSCVKCAATLKELSAPAIRKGMKESVIKFIRNCLLQLQVTSADFLTSKFSKWPDFWIPAIFSVRWNPILRSKFVIWFWFILSKRDTKSF